MPNQCHVCREATSKYKCPTCRIPYCLLTCYRSPAHVHDDHVTAERDALVPTKSLGADNVPCDKFSRIASDPVISRMLGDEALQYHLHVLTRILDDGSLSNANTMQDRLQVMNLKLNDLRWGGIEENEMVEEFIQRVIELHASYSETQQ